MNPPGRVHSPQEGQAVRLGHRYGMALFIFSEVMFFFAFFWAFFNASLLPFADGIAGRFQLCIKCHSK